MIFASLTLLLAVFQHELSYVLDRLDYTCNNSNNPQDTDDLLLQAYADFVCFNDVVFYSKHVPLARGNLVLGFNGIQRFLFILHVLWHASIACMLLTGAITMTTIIVAFFQISQ